MHLRPGVGPPNARIMLVGEAYGEHEEIAGEPFVGASGQELNRMLHDAGIMRSECFITNLVNARPPENDITAWIPKTKREITSAHIQLHNRKVLPIVAAGYKNLLMEIEAVKPKVILALGNYAMWALAQHIVGDPKGINNWRGSILEFRGIPLIPSIHPVNVLDQYYLRRALVADYKSAKRFADGKPPVKPQWNFILRPTFDQAMKKLQELFHGLSTGRYEWIDFDIETRAGHIACVGLSWSLTEAICIPFMCLESYDGYWSEHEEGYIVWWLYRVLTHPNVKVRWQNGLYDAQYTYKHWHFVPRGAQDTMISWHAIFSDLPKALHYQASLLCDYYIYWKDEGKRWEPKMGEEQLWSYNGTDCVRTREVGEHELRIAEELGLKQVHDWQQKMFWPVLQAMQRGVAIHEENRKRLAREVDEELERRHSFLRDVVGHPINPRSPKQMMALFYDDLQQQVVMKRAKKRQPSRPTCDDEALQKIGAREPLLLPLTNAIADIRTLEKFKSDFINARRSDDGRMRCSYNIGGSESGKSAPKTFRLSSSEDAFGNGCNLMTIPSEKSKSIGKMEKRGSVSFELPNIRSMYGPDPGFTFFDLDLQRADLFVVVWEADDELLKAAMRMGADIHLLNVYTLDNQEPPPLEELVETHPKYPDHRGPRKHKREFSKVFCHGTNYLGQPRTMAAHTGRLVAEIDRAQKRWFGAHPGIKEWHNRVAEQISKKPHFVENRFGYRWYIFDRISSALTEAVAWIPQSTVAIVINRIWLNLYERTPEVQVLLQVHDSLAGQFPTHLHERLAPRILEESKILVPYEDPLIIPADIKTSEISWGDCE
jgi:DNA polymerase